MGLATHYRDPGSMVEESHTICDGGNTTVGLVKRRKIHEATTAVSVATGAAAHGGEEPAQDQRVGAHLHLRPH
jgi:hypothetical protein